MCENNIADRLLMHLHLDQPNVSDGGASPKSETQVQEPGPSFPSPHNHGCGLILDILQTSTVVDDPRMFVDVLRNDGRKWFLIESEM
jgi:hypothetical protein